MATIDDLEAAAGPIKPELIEDPCQMVVMGPAPAGIKGTCLNCEFQGETLGGKTWINGAGQHEPMRYCYHFSSFVPARANFGCVLWVKQVQVGKGSKK